MTADLTREQLRELFLFEALSDERLDVLCQMGDVVEVLAGTAVFREGEPAECFYVLLSGTISMTRLVRGDELEITRTDHVGSYGGATQAYVSRTRRRSTRPPSPRSPTVGCSPCRGPPSRRWYASGSPWPSTCSRACSSACGPPTT